MPPENSLAIGYAPRGTAWYYATLHLPSAQRLPLLALQAWWRAVRNIPHAVSDVGVASAKLAWWEVQVGLCRDGRPEHPLLVTLQPALHAAHVAPEPLLRALAQVEETLRQSRWMDWRGLQRHLEEGPGQIARVACQISGPPSTHSQNLDYACALGVALAQVGLVRDVGRDVRRGMIFFPIDDLAAHAVKARQLLDCEDSPQVRALLRHAAERARLALTAADALRPKDMGGSARPGMALSRMGHALLREMERENYDLLRQRIALTPTRMLWSAWRAK